MSNFEHPICVIVPVYDQTRYLRRCLGSVIPQLKHNNGDQLRVMVSGVAPDSAEDRELVKIQHELLASAPAMSDVYWDFGIRTQRCGVSAARIERSTVPIEKGEPLKNELTAFVECVCARGTPVVSGAQAAEALKLAAAICRQIRGQALT